MINEVTGGIKQSTCTNKQTARSFRAIYPFSLNDLKIIVAVCMECFGAILRIAVRDFGHSSLSIPCGK